MKGGVPVTLDSDLKPRLLSRAGDLTLNDFCVGVLAEKFRVDHKPSGRPPRDNDPDKLVVNLDMAIELRDTINDALERENRRRRHKGSARLNRSVYLNGIFRNYLDAAERAAVA